MAFTDALNRKDLAAVHQIALTTGSFEAQMSYTVETVLVTQRVLRNINIHTSGDDIKL